MTHNAARLHRQAAERFHGAENGRKLVLIHTTVALGSSLLVAVINYLFSFQIAQTGGLSGMGLRTVLQTVQSVLELAVMLALPFWEIGILFAALGWSRGEQVDKTALLQGFRRLGSVLVFRLLYAGIFLMVGFGIFNIAAMIFTMTPLASGLTEQLMPLMDSSATTQQIEVLLTPEKMTAMAAQMVPLLMIFGVLLVPVAVILFYRLRFGVFFVIQGERPGRALINSLYITRKKGWFLVKLDLHFWWYYGLLFLCLAVGMGNVILPALGVSLPMSDAAAYFLTYTLGTALQGLLYWRCRGQVLCTYGVAFDALVNPETTEIV